MAKIPGQGHEGQVNGGSRHYRPALEEAEKRVDTVLKSGVESSMFCLDDSSSQDGKMALDHSPFK